MNNNIEVFNFNDIELIFDAENAISYISEGFKKFIKMVMGHLKIYKSILRKLQAIEKLGLPQQLQIRIQTCIKFMILFII